jgi:predicted enzyme related to lactoylglutathione lyase
LAVGFLFGVVLSIGVYYSVFHNKTTYSRDKSSGIFNQGIPATAFAVEDIQKEYERMKRLGVVFTTGPTKTEGPTIAVFDDTCGNLIQLYQE